MNSAQFDRWIQTLFTAISRRQTLLAVLPGVASLRGKDGVLAGPGCKNVGKKCKKKKDCCSGVCKGKKGRKKCKAHDTGGCQPDQQEDDCGGVGEDVICTTTAGDLFGTCQKTTGNAGYCGSEVVCFSCTKDAECRQICGPDAACILCEPSCSETGGTACAGPSECVGLPD